MAVTMLRADRLIGVVAIVCAALMATMVPALAQSVQAVQAQVTPVALEINKGQLFKLDRPAATVFIANPDIADVEVMSPTLIYVYGVGPGDTNLYAVGQGDQVIANLSIQVVPNISRMATAVDAIAPDSTVIVSAVEDSLVITGAVNSAVEAADLSLIAGEFVGPDGQVINRARVHGPNQVNLRVRIAEVQRSIVEQLGINWETVINPGTFLFGIAQGFDFIQFDEQTQSNQLIRNGDRYGLYLGNQGTGRNINTMIDALENEGMVTILAEPNLTAVSGETASFLAGGEFPIPVAGNNGDITIEYREFGVSLAFTPTLLSDNLISMRVRPEVSELSSDGAVQLNGFNVPSLITRRAETTVELGSGQSFAIAGLYQNSGSESISGLPFVSDIPILGALFRSEEFRRNETELVIVITPYLVQPPTQAPIVSPSDEFRGVSALDNPAATSVPIGTVGRGGTPMPTGTATGQPQGLVGGAGFILN